MNLTTDEQQYILGMLKSRYDELYKGQRDGVLSNWAEAEEEKTLNRQAQEKILGHKVTRAGYKYL